MPKIQTTEWEHCYVFLEKTLIDGTCASGDLMRRRVNGEWQYRRPTEKEAGGRIFGTAVLSTAPCGACRRTRGGVAASLDEAKAAFRAAWE